jgi:hypothetical protein
MAMVESIDIDVRWKSGRTVRVHVRIEEDLSLLREERNLDFERTTRRRAPIYPIDDDVLTSRDNLVAFLQQITRGEAAGATVAALCLQSDVPLLRERLGIEEPSTEPVLVQLSKDG